MSRQGSRRSVILFSGWMGAGEGWVYPVCGMVEFGKKFQRTFLNIQVKKV